ncbi:MAG: TIGR02285 family protein [Candidatus Competibacteraceae bacterium]
MTRSAILKPRRCALTLFSLLLLLIVAAPAFTQEKPVVVWYVLDFPPLLIAQGPTKGQGYMDVVMRQLIEQTPEFTHRITHSNTKRIYDTIRDTPNLCNPSTLWTPERTEFMVFSQPILRWKGLPNGIIIRTRQATLFAPFLNTAGELQLEKLLTEFPFRIGIVPDRAYGTEIDQILARHRERLVEVASSNQFASNLLKLATQTEFDAVVGYAEELHYLIGSGAVPAEFQFLPIAEARHLLEGGIGCSKTEEGQRIMAAFDRILSHPEVQAVNEAAYLRWLPNDRLRAYYLQRKAEQK